MDVSDSISENIGTGPAALQRCETARRNPFSGARPAVSRSGAGQREEVEIVIRYSLYAVHCPHGPPPTVPGLHHTLGRAQHHIVSRAELFVAVLTWAGIGSPRDPGHMLPGRRRNYNQPSEPVSRLAVAAALLQVWTTAVQLDCDGGALRRLHQFIWVSSG